MRFGRAEKAREAAKKAEDVVARDRAPALYSFWLNAAVGVALVLLCAFVAAAFAWAGAAEGIGRRQIQGYSDMLAQGLGDRVAQLQEQLREWGRDPELRTLLRNKIQMFH